MSGPKQKKTETGAGKNDTGTMPQHKLLYWQCKALLENSKVLNSQFSLGNVEFDKTRAKKFVEGVDRMGVDYVRKNYPCLCDGLA